MGNKIIRDQEGQGSWMSLGMESFSVSELGDKPENQTPESNSMNNEGSIAANSEAKCAGNGG